jgi:hypothetical protein
MVLHLSCNVHFIAGDNHRNCQQTFAFAVAGFAGAVLPAVAGLVNTALKTAVRFGVKVFDFCREWYAKMGAAIDVGEDLFAAA